MTSREWYLKPMQLLPGDMVALDTDRWHGVYQVKSVSPLSGGFRVSYRRVGGIITGTNEILRVVQRRHPGLTSEEKIAKVERFLNANYPCTCTGSDLESCPGNYYEAEMIVDLIENS